MALFIYLKVIEILMFFEGHVIIPCSLNEDNIATTGVDMLFSVAYLDMFLSPGLCGDWARGYVKTKHRTTKTKRRD